MAPLPLALAVVGSVMTLTYSLRFLGVFFGPYRCHRPNVHEAPLGMLLPPALLSVLVILIRRFSVERDVGHTYCRARGPGTSV